MPVSKRAILDSLTKQALVEYARGYEVAGFSTMDKGALVDALTGSKGLKLETILEEMTRDELKAACRVAGLDDSGREKQVIIDRLLGRADSDAAADDDSGPPGFALASEPPPAPRLNYSKARANPDQGDKPAKTRGAKRKIEQYEHSEAERLNNPPAGLVTPESDPVTPPPGTKARKQYQYDPHLDPQLVWAGKAERLSFEVDTVSLHVHERIDPKTILEAVKAKNGKPEEQLGLFGSPRENPPLREAIDFYKHPHGWSNRLIAGDSLLVMNSLLEKEGMAGKVQMVYFDPPYGITYKSNFMPFVNQRDVADRRDSDLNREPEVLKAFRDTWELGIHSYLAALRDRLLLTRDLLADNGCCFIQINAENCHLITQVGVEVFGADNLVANIVFRKKSIPLGAKYVETMHDHLVLFAKSKPNLKYRHLFEKAGVEAISSHGPYALFPDGHYESIDVDEFRSPRHPKGTRYYRLFSLLAPSYSESSDFVYTFEKKEYPPPSGGCWVTSEDRLDILARLGRLQAEGRSLSYRLFYEDFPYRKVTASWNNVGVSFKKLYAVQTSPSVLLRCIAMTTDPSDLVLDITCGSGTTAWAAEQLGRRWITCDTSRISITLAKQRLMSSLFKYFRLAQPEQGIASGFEYKTANKITGKSIASNPELHATMSPSDAEAAIAKYAEPVKMYDHPEPDPSKVRVAGPFTVEAVPAPVVRPVADLEADPNAVAREQGEADSSIARDGETLRQAQWRNELLKTGARGEGGMLLGFTRVEPLAGARYLHALGEVRDKGGFRKATWKAGDSVAICFGPEHAPLEQRVVQLAWEEARELTPRPAVLLFAAFQFDPEAQKDIDEMDAQKAGMLFLRAGMNDDLATEDLKKKRSSNESFWLIGQPEIALRRLGAGADGGKYKVEVQGFDYFDPKKGTIESGGTDRIAMWMLDTDYDGRSVFPRQVFFPMAGAKEGWSRLAASLRAEIDAEKIEAYRGVKSLAFEAGKFGRIAVKIVDDRGIESLVVRGLDEAEGAKK